MSVQGGSGPCVTKIKNGRFISQGNCEKIDEEEIIGQLRRNVAAKKEKESCSIYHDGKCIWPVKIGEEKTNFVSAVSICTKIRRKLADVQSREQYDLIVSYINPWLSETKDGEFSVWTGMMNNQTLSDGTKPTWWKDPVPLSETVKVAIRVSKTEPIHKLIYMKKRSKMLGAICQ
uniref:uncharacterized protein LOC120330378 n=1 Tax=Styela clava TaxID=7725 RepID=UPI001939A5C7|nr:uncharacterized protein LOC120330378 [Styela clava]